MDARGTLRFCNEFDMGGVRRFYTISNSTEHGKRGWIMHKRETKWFFPVRGKTKVKVEIEGGRQMSYLLDADDSAVLQVPPENWFLIEQDGTAEVLVFSNCTTGEFPDDDFRRPL